MRRNRYNRNSVYAHLGAGLAIAAVAITAFATLAGREQNTASIETQVKIARSFTATLKGDLNTVVQSYTYWQEAYDKVVANWDQTFVEWYFGDFVRNDKIQLSFVFDDKGAIKYAHGAGALDRAADGIARDPALAAMVKAALADTQTPPPKIVSAVAALGGHSYLVAAAKITAEHNVPPAAGGDKVLVFARPFAAADYQRLAHEFGLTAFDILPISSPAPDGKISMVLKDYLGQPIFRLAWTPYLPGRDFAREVVPFAATALLALALIGGLILRRWHTLQRELYLAEARATIAEEEGRAKLTFLGTMSHELRTPLNAIIGFSQVIDQQVFGPVGAPQYQEYIKNIGDSGAYLLTTLNDILDMAKFEGGKVKLPVEIVDAREEALSIVRELTPDAAEKGIAIQLKDTGPALAACDPRSLRRVLLNIVRNAIKFTESGGRIDVRAWKDSLGVHVEVRDTGIGIPPAMLDTVGRPFVQVEGNLARKNSGVGLGLAIANALMKLMRGTIDIDSVQGRGTTVTVTLPTAESHSAAAEAAAAE